jgi:hypothetical protein
MSPDPLTTARSIAIAHSDSVNFAVYKAVYLHELSQRMELSEAALLSLDEARAEVASLVGLA